MVQLGGSLCDSGNPSTDDVDESTKPYWIAPFAVTASQHFYGQTLKWKEEDGDNSPAFPNQDYVEKSGAFRPVVYVAARSHATYLRAGEFETPVATDTSNAGWAYMFPPNHPMDRARGNGSIFNPDSAELSLLSPAIFNFWSGYWGESPNPLQPLVQLTFGPGPPSAAFRGPGEQSSSTIIIQSNPKEFHNAYIKSSQSSISIP